MATPPPKRWRPREEDTQRLEGEQASAEQLLRTPPTGRASVEAGACVTFRPGASPVSRRRGQLAARALFTKTKEIAAPQWTQEELQALIEFVLLHSDSEGNSWVYHKQQRYWEGAAKFVQKRANTSWIRTGPACRSKATVKLPKQFATPRLAEQHYMHEEPTLERPEVVIANLRESFTQLSPADQLEGLSQLLQSFAVTRQQPVPSDFLALAMKAMEYLRESRRSNVVYSLVKGLGTMRDDGSDTLFPTKRMPMGALEYAVNFFIASAPNQVKCPEDYRQWLQTMYCLFGTKWAKMYAGPMWSIASITQGEVAAERIVNRPQELAMLDRAATTSPSTQWWLKGDACDLVKGLEESVKGVWSGDVDLNDNSLQHSYQQYQMRLAFVQDIGLEDLARVREDVNADLEYLHAGLQQATSEYEEKLKTNKATEKTMLSLAWKVEDLKQLSEIGREVLRRIGTILEKGEGSEAECTNANVPLQLTILRQKLVELVKGVTRSRRQPASHLFVLMISSEVRDAKPYALPVQAIPCAGIKEADLRRFVNSIAQEMVNRGMHLAGFVSNGEFNYMRSKGYTRPLTILQIRAQVRAKYARCTQGKLQEMLTPKRRPDGVVVAVRPNPAVSVEVLAEILKWKEKGATLTDIISRLRPRTVPRGYTFHTWRPGDHRSGKTETETDMMRSILAQMDYAYQVRSWQSKGVPFQVHAYVPEIHTVTGARFYEREDPGHLLKRIAASTRDGGPKQLCLERYVEALSDADSGLSYPALTGSRKQSVQDAERLFSPKLAAFMEKKGYEYEAKYIRAVSNWRRARDERGLSALQRCKFNYQLLNFILEELMPWYKSEYDFSLLEVNREVTGVCGFTRETLLGVLVDIESTEWRRLENVSTGLSQEHPRSSTTDDVECFFSVMRDAVGRNFTQKQAQVGFRKTCMEFWKRIDPDLPFFYYTSAHDRFYEGPRLDFSITQPSRRKKRLGRVPRREQPAVFVPGRATLPVRHSLSVRLEFHNRPLALPPPPTFPIHVYEHSYAH